MIQYLIPKEAGVASNVCTCHLCMDCATSHFLKIEKVSAVYLHHGSSCGPIYGSLKRQVSVENVNKMFCILRTENIQNYDNCQVLKNSLHVAI